MRFLIAVAAFAATAFAMSSRCSEWKLNTYANKAETEGWTKKNEGGVTKFYDKNGEEFTDWKS